MTANPPATAVVSVVRNGDRYLMVRRRMDSQGLSWVFPGGKVEAGETSRDASTREVREESGVTCEPASPIGVRIHPDTGTPIQYWLCDYVSGTPFPAEPDKIAEARWMTASEIRRSVSSDLYRGVLDIIEVAPEGERQQTPGLQGVLAERI